MQKEMPCWNRSPTNWDFQPAVLPESLNWQEPIADLAGAEHIETLHLSEAIQYRGQDREAGGDDKSPDHNASYKSAQI